ncbi:MAG TPA: DUF5665 domain-containing protein [Thermaerobacter sp.]
MPAGSRPVRRPPVHPVYRLGRRREGDARAWRVPPAPFTSGPPPAVAGHRSCGVGDGGRAGAGRASPVAGRGAVERPIVPPAAATGPAGVRPLLQRVLRRLDDLSWRWQRLSIAEYLELFRHPGRLFWFNFLAGLARGLGAAVGFTLLGALVLLALQRAVELNLPFIGNLIADLLRIVRTELESGRPGPGGAPPTP